jgi:15-cis-phytoene synthase
LSVTTSLLDDSMVNRAAPPGSMRYFALLYTPAAKREAVTALFIVETELRESARSANHDVAHTRLAWWRAEIDRLVNGSPQHPAMRALNAPNSQRRERYAKLHELAAAADMDLARMTYANAQELRAYAARSGGALAELIAEELAAPDALEPAARASAQRIGGGVRQAEMLRDLRQDAFEGRLYAPLDELDAQGLTAAQLQARESDARAKRLLSPWAARVREELAHAHGADADLLRPLNVLAALHRRLLDRIAAHDYDVAARRIDLGPVEKPWVAWRAARAR